MHTFNEFASNTWRLGFGVTAKIPSFNPDHDEPDVVVVTTAKTCVKVCTTVVDNETAPNSQSSVAAECDEIQVCEVASSSSVPEVVEKEAEQEDDDDIVVCEKDDLSGSVVLPPITKKKIGQASKPANSATDNGEEDDQGTSCMTMDELHDPSEELDYESEAGDPNDTSADVVVCDVSKEDYVLDIDLRAGQEDDQQNDKHENDLEEKEEDNEEKEENIQENIEEKEEDNYSEDEALCGEDAANSQVMPLYRLRKHKWFAKSLAASIVSWRRGSDGTRRKGPDLVMRWFMGKLLELLVIANHKKKVKRFNYVSQGYEIYLKDLFCQIYNS